MGSASIRALASCLVLAACLSCTGAARRGRANYKSAAPVTDTAALKKTVTLVASALKNVRPALGLFRRVSLCP